MTALTNAQRQKRWRERHKTGDLFPPFQSSVAASIAPVERGTGARAGGVQTSPTLYQAVTPVMPVQSAEGEYFHLVSCRI